jgi:hypothetical protein
MEPEYIAGLLVTALIGLAGVMIRNYFSHWETRMIAQDDRLDDHDSKYTDHAVQIATIKANMEHIRTTGDETSKDVKTLLRHSNGNRATG